jgi:hypothetical membrane protein
MIRPHSSTRRLAGTVLGTVGLFPLLVLTLTLVQARDGYRSGREAVSDLALGRDGGLMAVAFCSLGVGTLAFAVLLRQTSRSASVRAALVAVAGMLSFVSATFHTDATGAPITTHGEVHNAAGIVTFLAMLVTMAVSARRFRNEPLWRGFSLPTTVLAVVGVAAFLLVPVLGQAHFGIVQRLLIGSFLAWLLGAATHHLRVTAPDAQRRSLVDTVAGL